MNRWPPPQHQQQQQQQQQKSPQPFQQQQQKPQQPLQKTPEPKSVKVEQKVEQKATVEEKKVTSVHVTPTGGDRPAKDESKPKSPNPLTEEKPRVAPRPLDKSRSRNSSSSSSSSSGSSSASSSDAEGEVDDFNIDCAIDRFHLAIFSSMEEGDPFYCGEEKECSHNDYKKFIAGSWKVEFKDRYWHAACFRCADCKVVLKGENINTKDDKLYCKKCLIIKFAKRCRKCRRFTFEGVVYKDKYFYHRECFRCNKCNHTLPPGPRFMTLENKHYCMECYAEHYAKHCVTCDRAIVGPEKVTTMVKLGEEYWHPECFECQMCRKKLPKLRFFKYPSKEEKKEKIVCKECLKIMFTDQHLSVKLVTVEA